MIALSFTAKTCPPTLRHSLPLGVTLEGRIEA
jgi:hypothetical protein